MKNNKGFSLVELIIVLAILAVVTGTSFVAIGYVYGKNVKSSIEKIDSSLLKIQSYTMSQSTGGRDIYLRLTKKSDGYYAEYWRTGGTSPIQSDNIGKKNFTITAYYGGGASGSVEVNSASPVEIYFDRSTGGLLPLTAGGDTYWNKIEVKAGGTGGYSVSISKITGKTEIKKFQ